MNLVLTKKYIFSTQSGGLTADEFKLALQEATNFPLRSYVLPFLKTHVPYLQRDIASQARACNQVRSAYISCIIQLHPVRKWAPLRKLDQFCVGDRAVPMRAMRAGYVCACVRARMCGNVAQ